MFMYCCSVASAQTASVQFTGGAKTCAAYCATGSCTATTITVTATNRPAGFTYQWLLAGGIDSVAGSRTNNNTTGVYTLQVRSKAGNYCKGAITFRWAETTNCPPSFSVSQDVFKTFNRGNLDATWVALYGGVVGTIVGPTCVSPSASLFSPNRVTYSIHPFISTCAADNLGQDSYKWVVPSAWTNIYYSDDSSSITVTMPVAASLPPSGVVECFVGTKCNGQTTGVLPAGNRYSLTIARSPSAVFILATGVQGQISGGNIPNASGCLASDSIYNLTLTAFPDESSSGYTYQWDSLPPGYVRVSGSLSSRTITVATTAPGPAGVFGVSVTNPAGGCFAQRATYRLIRTTRTRYQSLVISPACFDSATTGTGVITINLTNPSPGQPYSWAIPSGYTPVGAVNGSQLILRPTAGAADLPIFVSAQPNNSAGCLNNTIQGNLKINTNGGAAVPVFINRSGPTTRSFFLSGSNTSGTTWTPGTCNAANFSYQWIYTGYMKNTGSPCFGSVDRLFLPSMNYSGPDIFPTGTTSSSVEVNCGTYTGTSTGGTGFLLCVITQSGSPCATASCFRKVVKFAMPTAQILPRGGDDTDLDLPISYGRTSPTEANSLELMPNPASQEVTVKLGHAEQGGIIEVYAADGKRVRKLAATPTTRINLQGLPKGIYRVAYLGTKEGSVATHLVVE